MKIFLIHAMCMMYSALAFSQNVGIGITTPVFKLDVRNGSINVDSLYRIGSSTVLAIPGMGNLFLGKNAGRYNTGTYNTFSGDHAGYNNTTGYYNAFFGHGAGYSNTTGYFNSFFGLESGVNNVSGNNNSFYGKFSGYNNTVGNDNSFFGESSGSSNTTGSFNSFFGKLAGNANTTGNENSFFGLSSGAANSTGINNSFFGRSAGAANTTGYNNSFFGRTAGYSNTYGFANSCFGHDAGAFLTTGHNNSFFGEQAGYFTNHANNNSFSGRHSGYHNLDGSSNSFFGERAGFYNNDGSLNTFIGQFSGGFNTVGFYNTSIGCLSQVGETFNNATSLGYNAISDATNKVRIGSTGVVSNGGQVSWTASSDGRIKDNIQENIPGLDFINALRPVTYHFNTARQNELMGIIDTTNWTGKFDIEKIQFSGFIAQEVEAAAQSVGYDFSGVDKSGEIMGLRYAEFTVPLVKAIQEQQVLIAHQQKEIDELRSLVNQLVVRMDSTSQ